MDTFNVLIVYGVFRVLFGFRRCDFRSSDLFPFLRGKHFLNIKIAHLLNQKSSKIIERFAWLKIYLYGTHQHINLLTENEN